MIHVTHVFVFFVIKNFWHFLRWPSLVWHLGTMFDLMQLLTLQDFRLTTSRVVSTMMCLDLVVNKDNREDDPLEACRKVCAFMAKKLGISRDDLQPMTKIKLDSISEEHEPASAAPSLSVTVELCACCVCLMFPLIFRILNFSLKDMPQIFSWYTTPTLYFWYW